MWRHGEILQLDGMARNMPLDIKRQKSLLKIAGYRYEQGWSAGFFGVRLGDVVIAVTARGGRRGLS